MSIRATLLLAASTCLVACASPPPAPPSALEAAVDDWDASLVHESDAGIWTTGTVEAFDAHGCPAVFALDDAGRCTLVTCYSGNWTPNETVADGAWLGALARVDLDARRDGRELYVGGRSGTLYQIVVHADTRRETRIVARLPGEEIHALAAGDLDPRRAGHELLVFTRSGAVHLATRGPDGPSVRVFDDVGGRIRQAAVLPTRGAERPWIAAACRCGELLLLRVGDDGLERRVVASEAMGLGRLAVAPGATPDHAVVYVTRDDGLILRIAGRPGVGPWTRELVYAGPQGPRGLVAGTFDDDPATETLATFGYSGRVQLLTRSGDGPWSARTIFEDRDRGHWLARAELDGRNATDELLASGYGKRIVMLARPPGYGLPGVALDDRGASGP